MRLWIIISLIINKSNKKQVINNEHHLNLKTSEIGKDLTDL